MTEERLKQISTLNQIALNRGQTLSQMALAWVLRNGDVCSALIGASKKEQIIENINAVKNLSFTSEELKKIDEVSLI